MPRIFSSTVLVSLIVLGCRSAEMARGRVDPVLVAFIPADVVMLTGVRMEEIRSTPLYQKMVAKRRLQQLDQFAVETGFDPRKDVRELLVASNGKESVVLARGKFDIHGIKGARRSAYKGYTLYSGEQGGVALLDRTTAVAGNLPSVRAAIDQYKSGSRGGAAALLARAQEIPANNQVWSVSSGWTNLLGKAMPQTGNAANFSKIFRSLENTTFAADMRSGLNAIAAGDCRTEQDAKNLGDAVRGLVGMGRLSVPDDRPELLRFYDGIKVEQQQRSIRIIANIPQDLLDKFLEMTSGLL